MTPADLAMKAALDESARYARSPPAAAPAANPLVGRTSHPNVTSPGPRLGKPPDPAGTSSRPTTPHVTLHQYHKLQHSPVPLSPDLDYKRVRRKQSFDTLIRLPPGPLPLHAPHTSSSTLPYSSSPKSLLPSLLPPLPTTQLAQPSTYSPSLSSTVDTLQSTPTHSPIHRIFRPLGQGEEPEQGGLSEPIRTKRKFLPLKQAKRLPHHSAHHGAGECTWEVHAAVVDIGFGTGEPSDSEGEDAPQGVITARERAWDRIPDLGTDERATRRHGRIVRFQDLETEKSSNAAEDDASRQPPPRETAKQPSLTSSISLSRFQFPAPPGSHWEGTFGHLTEPSSPISPATLHYRGVSFDVVNPHTSLLLGVSDIETPAEIDGLLDHYFDRSLPNMQPYNDPTGEKSTSQYSLQTSASNGRQRILYDDADSARRNIMGIQGQDSDIPPMPTSTPPSIALPMRPRRPPTPAPFVSGNDGQRREIQVHPNLREALGLDTGSPSQVAGDPTDHGYLEDAPAEIRQPMVSTHESHCYPAFADGPKITRFDDRPNSLYPHSRRSDPFDLDVDYDDDDLIYSNVNTVVTGRRTSRSAARGGHAEDFAIYEDADDANARTQSTLGQETTVGNIVGHYNYPRPPFGTEYQYTSPYGDGSTQSASIGIARGTPYGTNPFLPSHEETSQSMGVGIHQTQAQASQTFTSPDLTYARLRRAPRVPGPPVTTMPTPPFRAPYGTGWNPFDPDFIATDQTYGSTGQLLRLTPQAERFATGGRPFLDPPTEQRRRPLLNQGFEDVPLAPVATRRTRTPPPLDSGDEDKENTPPPQPRPSSSLSVTPGHEPIVYNHGPRRLRGPATVVDVPALMQGSPTLHGDDDSIWESTQASGSREYLPGTLNEPMPMQYESFREVRPSQDSYANTSIAGSNNRQSLIRPGIIRPRVPGRIHYARPAIVERPTERPVIRYSGPMAQVPAPSDEERARNILEDKMMEDAMVGPSSMGDPQRNPEQNTSNMKELEEIRKRNPDAVEKAVKAVSETFGRLTQMQPTYTPQGSASTMWPFGMGRNTPDSRYSETQGLLADQIASPYANQGLRFNETANTFQTTRRMPSFLASRPVEAYSPLTPPLVPPPATAHVRDSRNRPGTPLRDFDYTPTTRTARSRPTIHPVETESIELQPMPRRGRVSRVAMSSQTELRPLQLAESTAASGISGRLTDAQLVEAEGTWSMRPGLTENRTLTPLLERYSGVRASLHHEDDGLPDFNFLMRPQDARDLTLRRVQSYLTRTCFRLCVICPITALIFACGGFDWRMRQMTGGRITEMYPPDKRAAAQIFLPLGLLFYSIVALVIVLLVTVTKSG